jgi:tetratricopeptide (TPR) repeat protein
LRHALRLFATVAALAGSALAQFDHHAFGTESNPDFRRSQLLSVPLQGRLELPEGAEPTRLRVLIVDLGRRAVLAETYASFNGAFDFPALPAGVYDLQVRNLNGDVIHQLSVSIPSATALVVRMTQRPQNLSARSVSARRLAHKIPKAARQDYEKAREQLSDPRKSQDVLARLEHAVELDPEFFEALSVLGAIHLQARHIPQALAFLEKAALIDRHDATLCSNLSLAYLNQHKLVEAETAARDSLEANALNPRARFFLAISLLEQGKARPEAIFHLKQAQQDFPPAQALLAKLEAPSSTPFPAGSSAKSPPAH